MPYLKLPARNRFYILLAIFSVFFLIYLTLKSVLSVSQAQLNCPKKSQGDANCDDSISLIDFEVWRREFTGSVTTTNADFSGDGRVTLVDFEIWRRGFTGNITQPTPTDSQLPTLTPTISALTPTPTQVTQPSVTTSSNNVRLVYTASNEDFPNPERGFMKQSSIWLDQPLDPNKIRAIMPSDTVVWIYFRLENYRDPRDGIGVKLCADLNNCTNSEYRGKLIEPLGSGIGLDTLKAAFNTARSKGLKLVIRFIYNWGPGSTPDPLQANPDVPLFLALQHIDQLKPLVIENTDVIGAMQIGFIGHWAEWHSSKYMNSLTSRKAITDALLNVLPKDRMLMIRYPRYKQIFLGDPLTEQEAYTQTDRSRVGHHNDCFLRDTDDTTYRSTEWGLKQTSYCDGRDVIACWKDFVAQEGRFTPVGGETCQYNPPRTDCPNAQGELETLHWSLINNDYRLEVLNGWVAGGCMDTIRRRLGYRLLLTEATLPKSVQSGGGLNFEVRLTNIGYASMFNERPVYAVLQGTNNRYEIPLPAIDPRRWESGLDLVININTTLPNNIVPGAYKLGLWLPDKFTSLRNNPAYTVRFANTNVWDQSTGINILTSNIEVR